MTGESRCMSWYRRVHGSPALYYEYSGLTYTGLEAGETLIGKGMMAFPSCPSAGFTPATPIPGRCM